MSSSKLNNQRAATGAAPKSPILMAIVISLSIAAGTMAATLDPAPVKDLLSGQWLTRPLAETQERNSNAIASLETRVGAIVREIDFVTSRIGAAARRGEEQASGRFAHIDAEITGLKDRLAGVQARAIAPVAHDALIFGSASVSGNLTDMSGEMTGLRTSLHELAATHTGTVAAITRRLDRIEIMMGASTDVVSSMQPLRRPQARHRAPDPKAARKQDTAPLRLSLLPG